MPGLPRGVSGSLATAGSLGSADLLQLTQLLRAGGIDTRASDAADVADRSTSASGSSAPLRTTVELPELGATAAPVWDARSEPAVDEVARYIRELTPRSVADLVQAVDGEAVAASPAEHIEVALRCLTSEQLRACFAALAHNPQQLASIAGAVRRRVADRHAGGVSAEQRAAAVEQLKWAKRAPVDRALDSACSGHRREAFSDAAMRCAVAEATSRLSDTARMRQSSAKSGASALAKAAARELSPAIAAADALIAEIRGAELQLHGEVPLPSLPNSDAGDTDASSVPPEL
eukprot:TRINITY_DN26613_c0_g1_i1.p3 TRINITY_DN26613_c0_g1~~TRINITY_DN26613_c0_g1_i1.p3  ORF type:complete len:290 (+),score=92.38 TRINITY_DN26613_c0_g1_i1:54-923(+)